MIHKMDKDSIQILGIEKNDVDLMIGKVAGCVDEIAEDIEPEDR